MGIAHQALGAQDAAIILNKAFLRCIDNLELSRAELSHIVGFSAASISRLCDGKKQINPESKEGELILLVLRVYRSLDAIFGGNQAHCRVWLRADNNHLQAIPLKKMYSICGLNEVAFYLDAFRAKV